MIDLFLPSLLAAGLAGLITGFLVRGAELGIVGDVLIGFCGGMLAIYVPRYTGHHLAGINGTLIAPAVCASLLSLFVGALRRL